jgi:hypothetical protein
MLPNEGLRRDHVAGSTLIKYDDSSAYNLNLGHHLPHCEAARTFENAEAWWPVRLSLY